MPTNAPPANIRASLATAAGAAAGTNPDVGFGSRTPWPNEKPDDTHQRCDWKGEGTFQGLVVNWDDKFVYDFGKSREDRKSVPAVGISLRLAFKLETGQVVSIGTRKLYWCHEDPKTALPDSNIPTFKDKNRVEGERNIAKIKGWFQNLLGVNADDAILNNPVDFIAAADSMLADAESKQSSVQVEAGFVKDWESYPIKNGDRKGQTGWRKSMDELIYKNFYLVGAQPAAQGG